jgi:hypothetical protein
MRHGAARRWIPLVAATLATIAISASCAAREPATSAAASAPVDHAGETRHLRPARDLDIWVTRWDAVLAAAGGRPRITADDLLARDREGETSFTVILELAHRPPVAQGAEIDPLAAPESWEFRLARPGAGDLIPLRVDVHALDRFPRPGGGHHYRLALAVHFAGVAARAPEGKPAAEGGATAGPAEGRSVAATRTGMHLRIRSTAKVARRADALGRQLHLRGAVARFP